ncbi:MAG: Xaa-Pro peptidase family protein [Oscillospiraceae bacterium]
MENTRMKKVLERMEERGIDALFLCPSSNMSYILGSSPIIDERLYLLVLAPEKEPFIIANALYEPQVSELQIPDAYYWRDGEDPYPLLQRQLNAREIHPRRAAVDSSMQARFFMPLTRLLPDTHFVSAEEIINALRVFKDEAEGTALREACKKADAALAKTMERGADWLGHSEAEFFAQLAFEMGSLGLKEPGACVCVGENAADPHYQGGSGIIEKGKCLLVDFGGTFNNYYTDMTRTFFFGEPDEDFRKIHSIVLEANLAAQNAAKLGNELQEVDAAARRVIENYGYGRYFIHRTGHGIGIDVHENPNAAKGETAEIRPGMAFSIEPGIYLPGRFGVRIEDEALMTEEGVEILHSFPRELISY